MYTTFVGAGVPDRPNTPTNGTNYTGKPNNLERMIKMAKYIDTNELYNKLRGRISVRQLEIIKELINECDTITVESEDE